MATLSLNEIRSKARAFSKDFKDASKEAQDAKLFWYDFFGVFGVPLRRVKATFEQKVKKLNDKTGYIDLLWPGKILVEHKTKGEDLDSAYKQATDYAAALEDHELPRLILVSDFARIRVYDLEDDAGDFEFPLADLYKYVPYFSWMAGYKAQKAPKPQAPVDIKAIGKIGDIHDQLEKLGYKGHPLEMLLVRLVFCLFAESTGIFEPGLFAEYVENQTAKDGSDLGAKLSVLFDTLDIEESKRQPNLDDELKAFPYVNGRLFAESIRMPVFTKEMRRMVMDASTLNWSEISPAIFGNLFQSIKDKEARRGGGEHYTSEENILKVVNSLFMDRLREEFKRVRGQKTKLEAFQAKLGTYRFLDPACGCGNFLVVAYREMRQLELEVLMALHEHEPRLVTLLLQGHLQVGIEHFFGIEIEEFPAQIAQVAMWLVEHQANRQLGAFVGDMIANIPLTSAATIVHDNAVRTDWTTLITGPGKGGQVFILGNPPFIGSKMMKKGTKKGDAMRADMSSTFKGTKNLGSLDYVACWYRKAADYMDAVGPEHVRCAFVSTNSITQGDQVSVLWGPLLTRGFHIDFAHRTFRWNNEGKHKAAVHCVIVGFSKQATGDRHLYDYPDIAGASHRLVATNINPYLIDFEDVLITKRQKPLCDVPLLKTGNKLIDDGNYIFTDEGKAAFLEVEPQAEPYFRPFLGSEEYINGQSRWILLLQIVEPQNLALMPESKKRIKAVTAFREKSTDSSTRKLAKIPTRFHVENMPEGEFLVVPKVSSERRPYLPMGFMNDAGHTLCSDLLQIGEGMTRYHYGILSSAMHMAWMRTVCGRLKSDYRYSIGIVYNCFPWPMNATPKQVKAIEDAAEAVLAARAVHPAATLADLYNPDTTPSDLAKAHIRLDKAVDAAYESDGGQKSWSGDLERVKFLFLQYKTLVPMKPAKKPVRPKKATMAKV
jgi:hypothetical protein